MIKCYTYQINTYHRWNSRKFVSNSPHKIGREAQGRNQQRSQSELHLKPSNPTSQETKALKELRQDKDRVILTVDKGVATRVLDKHDYIHKVQVLLAQRDTYRALIADPTNKHKNKLVNIFRTNHVIM